jgi:hypothetical protein
MKRFIKSLFSSPRSSAKTAARKRLALQVESLEERQLMTGSFLTQVNLSNFITPTQTTNTDTLYTKFGDSVINQTINKYIIAPPVPQLSSLPGSPHTLYLNFEGDYRSSWWQYTDWPTDSTKSTFTNVQMDRFDTDGDINTFSDTEKAQITEIWARVAEAYSPFNINVTTVDPGNLNHGQTVMVDIGYSNNWLGSNATGTSSIGSFNNDAPNVVFDFIDQIGNWRGEGLLDPTKDNSNFVAQVANTASHEAGHAFGLVHDQVFDSNHQVTNQYDPGSGNWTPIMATT